MPSPCPLCRCQCLIFGWSRCSSSHFIALLALFFATLANSTLSSMDKAFYQLQPKELPAKFLLPQRTDELINRTVPKHIFTKELEYITKSEDRRHRQNPVESIASSDDFVFGTVALDNPMNEFSIGAESTNGPPSPTIMEYETRFQIIETMMKSTNQEREVCLFYLESTNWDVNEAVNLFKNTS